MVDSIDLIEVAIDSNAVVDLLFEASSALPGVATQTSKPKSVPHKKHNIRITQPY